MMNIVHNVVRKVDINQSELCIAYACMVYECKNKHGFIRLEANKSFDSTYIDEYLPNQTLKVQTLNRHISIEIGLFAQQTPAWNSLNNQDSLALTLRGNTGHAHPYHVRPDLAGEGR